MLIGERPGQEESYRSRPFCGPSGRYLDICLEVAGLTRADIYITNVVKTFNEYGKPTPTEIARDHDELVLELVEHSPRVIGLIGGIAVEEVLGRRPAEMEKCHGVPVRMLELFGGDMGYSSLFSERYREESPNEGWLVVPLLHPANCVYSPEIMPNVLDDFLRLARVVDGELEPIGEGGGGVVGGRGGETGDYRCLRGAEGVDEILGTDREEGAQ